MKRPSFILVLIFFMLMPMAAGYAQNPVHVIDTLEIEFWPDYDRTSVLVLLTGALPKDTQFPASVTLPLPEGAQLNAVARIDSKDGDMKDDIFSSTDSAGTLTFNTSDLRFRVEYYLSYTVDQSQRSFDFTWLAAVTVNRLQLSVQRPTSAGTLSTDPAAANVVRGADGFDYHIFAARAVTAGQPFTLHVEYKMTTAQLSATGLPRQNTGIQTPATPATPGTGSSINWALAAVVAGGLIIIAALIWQITSRRRASNMSKPVASRVANPSQKNFCGNCGAPTGEGDNFCSSCGSEL